MYPVANGTLVPKLMGPDTQLAPVQITSSGALEKCLLVWFGGRRLKEGKRALSGVIVTEFSMAYSIMNKLDHYCRDNMSIHSSILEIFLRCSLFFY